MTNLGSRGEGLSGCGDLRSQQPVWTRGEAGGLSARCQQPQAISSTGSASPHKPDFPCQPAAILTRSTVLTTPNVLQFPEEIFKTAVDS